MTTTRLEAFSDAVIAIVITIMVLEFETPEGAEWSSLRPLLPTFLAYVLSFVFLGTYWNNHHHMMHITERVNGAVLWANLLLLFWLSLVPFTTRWMGSSHLASVPVAVYGAVLLLSGVSYFLLEKAILRLEGPASRLGAAVGSRRKELLSLALYMAALPVAFVDPRISIATYVAVVLLWLIPDRRIEAAL